MHLHKVATYFIMEKKSIKADETILSFDGYFTMSNKQFKQWHNKLLLAYRSSSPESRPDDLVNNAIISYENI